MAPEARVPEPVAQQRERGTLVRRHEAVSDFGVHLQDVEQVRRHRRGLDFARIPGAGEVIPLRGSGRDSGEVVRQGAQVVEVREGHAEPHAPEPGGHDLEEAVRSRVRQRLEEHGVHRAEDGGVGADTEGEREHGHGGEAGALRERADGKTEILEERVHHSYLKATIGSTRAARREGTKLASTVTPSSTTVTNPKTSGSCGDSWNNSGLSQWPPARAITTPITIPAAPSDKPSSTTSLTRSRCCAPRAARTPSSWVRCETV